MYVADKVSLTKGVISHDLSKEVQCQSKETGRFDLTLALTDTIYTTTNTV